MKSIINIASWICMICSPLICAGKTSAPLPPILNGTLIQALSSRLVQETTELSWSCVTVNVSSNTQKQPDTITLRKQGILPNGSYVKHDIFLRRVISHTDPIVFQQIGTPVEDRPLFYILRDQSTNYVIWIANNGIRSFVYVWTKDLYKYKVNDEINVLAKLFSWNYSDYLTIAMPSYDFSCNLGTELPGGSTRLRRTGI